MRQPGILDRARSGTSSLDSDLPEDYEEVRPRDVVFEFRSATAGRDGSKNFGQPSECKIFLHPKLLQDGEQVCADH